MSTSIGETGSLLSAHEARARVSWPAIFSGVVLVVAIQIMLTVFGAGIGFGFVSPGQPDGASAQSLGIGAGAWWLVSTILSLGIGSYVAARLAGVGARFDGALHGLVVWGLALFLALYLVTSAAGGLLGGAFSVIGGAVSAAGSAVGSATATIGDGVKAVAPQVGQAAGIDAGTLQRQAESLIRSPTPQDPASMNAADATKAVGQALPALLAGGDKAAAAKQRIIDIVAAQAHVSPQEAQSRVDAVVAQADEARQQAVETAKNAAASGAAAASHASFLACVGLLIGAIAAAIGGAIASPRESILAARRFRA